MDVMERLFFAAVGKESDLPWVNHPQPQYTKNLSPSDQMHTKPNDNKQ